MDEEAKTAAAETVQRAVRACVARRALLALRHEAHVTDAARQHDNVPDAAVPHVPPTPPSPQQEETDQGAASGGHYSSDFAQESMVQEVCSAAACTACLRAAPMPHTRMLLRSTCASQYAGASPLPTPARVSSGPVPSLTPCLSVYGMTGRSPVDGFFGGHQVSQVGVVGGA